MSRAKLLSLIALVGGPVLAVTTHNEMELRKRVEKEGVTVAGQISGGEMRSRRGVKNYEFSISYVPPKSPMITKKFKVPKDFAAQYVNDKELIRDDVQVRCLAADPNVAFVVGTGDGDPEM